MRPEMIGRGIKEKCMMVEIQAMYAGSQVESADRKFKAI